MNRHAKASSAGSSMRQAAGLGRSFRGAAVTRGASSEAKGSGTPSRSRTQATLLALAAGAIALLAFAPLSQAKIVVTGFGIPAAGPQAFGGQFAAFLEGSAEPRGVAVNTSGNGAPAGTSYVVDGFGGNRVQRFSPSGSFQRLWGQDVIAPSVNEQQRLLVNAIGGTYTLTFNGSPTDPIAFDADSSAIDNALGALPSISGDANVNVSGNPNDIGIFFIAFTGALAASDQPQITVDASQLNGTAEITTLADGTPTTASTGTGFEICTVAIECQKGSTSGAFGGQLNNPQGVAVNQANGDVYVTDQGNRRISEFDADGNFIRTWGWDVIAGGEPNDTGTGFEICEVAAECKRGASGANGGEFGETTGYPITDSSNDVWVPDASNLRIQKFDSTGNFIAAYGYNVDALGGGGELEKCTSTASGACQAATPGSGAGQFGSAFYGIGDIAFDSSGNLYAIDPGNNRVQKFDPTLLASATAFGASTFPTYTTEAPQHLVATSAGTRLAFGLTNDVTGGGERQIIELDPADASVKDTSLVGSGVNTVVGGLAAGTAGNLYATVETALFEGKRVGPPRNVLVLGDTPPPAPAPVLNPVSVKTDTTATLSATVDPNGGLVTCKFQYSTDQSNWTDVPAPDCSSFASSGVQAVSRGATGLLPNTHYFLRLQVSRPLLSNSTVTSFTKSFDTDSVPPVVSGVGAVQVQDTSARMVATIDPRNSATGYVFEYGTTPSLGSSTAPLDVGGGTTPITVSQVVGGLSKDTTYYYKLVATNAFGSTSSNQETLHTRTIPFPPSNPGNCPNEAVRLEQSSTYLPDCRAYEMVSPSDKNQGSVIGSSESQASISFSEDGEGVAFCSNSLFGEPPTQQAFTCGQYLARRGPGGWSSNDPFPRYCTYGTEGNVGLFSVHLVGESYDRAVLQVPEFESACDPLDPTAPRPSINLYREDLAPNPFQYQLLAPHSGGLGAGLSQLHGGRFAGGTADLSHVFYTSFYNQTADSPTPEERFGKLYEWEEEGQEGCAETGGCLSLVSVAPNGEPFTGSSTFPAAGGAGSSVRPNPSAISEDGQRVYFNTPLGGFGRDYAADLCSAADCTLYMREGGATTFQVSASECTASCGVDASPDQFRWASPEGDVAIFSSCAKLTDASAPAVACTGQNIDVGYSGKLYRWDRNGAPGHRLTDISVDEEPSDGEQPHAADIVGASEDGDVVYFVAGGQLVSGAPTGSILGTIAKLYRWRYNGGAPELDYLGPYQGAQANGANSTFELDFDPNTDRYHDRVTPDGRYLAILSKLALDPVADRDASADMYRWDEEDGWQCVSCQLPGVASKGNASSTEVRNQYDDSFFEEYEAQGAEHTISDDGQRIFFSTPDALVPQDVNGEAGCEEFVTKARTDLYSCADVYEWHDGTVSLVTSGTGSHPFLLVGATPTGRDVFVISRERLVGWDQDNGVDIYDVRRGGGFAEPPVQPPSCEGAEQCHLAGTSAPATTGAGTAVFEGPGNPAPRHGKPRKQRKKHHQKRAQKRHQRAANHNRRAGR